MTNHAFIAALVARRMQAVRGGTILLRDEANKRDWVETVAAFSLSSVAVTQELYALIVTDYAVTAPELPAVNVSWIDALAFCNALSELAGLQTCYAGIGHPDAEHVTCDISANGYRLPTEAEWEFACRAGSNEARYGELDEIAWHRGNSGELLREVGLKQANAWGFHDMIGNVWEWCWNLYDPNVYGPYRVFRGGGFSDLPHSCRASCRRKSHPTFRVEDVGFRVARSGDKTAASV